MRALLPIASWRRAVYASCLAAPPRSPWSRAIDGNGDLVNVPVCNAASAKEEPDATISFMRRTRGLVDVATAVAVTSKASTSGTPRVRSCESWKLVGLIFPSETFPPSPIHAGSCQVRSGTMRSRRSWSASWRRFIAPADSPTDRPPLDLAARKRKGNGLEGARDMGGEFRRTFGPANPPTGVIPVGGVWDARANHAVTGRMISKQVYSVVKEALLYPWAEGHVCASAGRQ